MIKEQVINTLTLGNVSVTETEYCGDKVAVMASDGIYHWCDLCGKAEVACTHDHRYAYDTDARLYGTDAETGKRRQLTPEEAYWYIYDGQSDEFGNVCENARTPEVRIEGAATLHSCLRRGASRSASAGRPSVRGAAAPDRLISQSHNKVIEQRPHRSDFFNGTAHHRAKQNTKTMGPDASASGLRFRRQLKVRRPQGTRITAAMSRGMKSWWSSMNMEAMRNSMAMMPMIGRSQPTSVTPPVPAGE